MRLLPFLIASSCALALCHYYLIPILERRLRSQSFMKSLRLGALLASAGLMRGIFLINIFVMLMLIAIVGVLQMIGGTTMTDTTSAIRTIQQWRFFLVGFGFAWGVGTAVIILIALGVCAYRKGKKHLEFAFNIILERELKFMQQEREQNGDEELPRTQKMEKLHSEILKTERRIIEINWKGATEARVESSKRQLTDRLHLLRRQYDMLDLRRRAKRALDAEKLELSEPHTRWEKTQAFLMSRRLLASLGTGARFLFLAGFILLIPSLAGVYAVTTERMLDNRLTGLHDIRRQIDAREWEAAKERLGPPVNELSDKDKQVLEEIAHAFEIAVPIPAPPQSKLNDWYMMHSFAVRQKILESAVKQSPTPLELHPSWSQIDTLDDAERRTITLYDSAIDRNGPSTQSGREIYAKLEEIAKRSHFLMEKMRDSVQDIQKANGIYDIRRAMLTQIMESPGGDGSGGNGNIDRGLYFKVNRSLYDLAQQDRERNFIAGLMSDGNLKDMLRNIGTIQSLVYSNSPCDFAEYKGIMQDFRDELPVSRVNAKVRAYPPSADALPDKDIDMKIAAAKVEELIKYSVSKNPLSKSARYTDTLAQYQDHFPGQLGAELGTERGQCILRLAAATSTIPDFKMSEWRDENLAHVSQGSFDRAHNFISLRGFSRIGGVLIGREPSDIETAKLDCTDLEWEVEGNNIRLILTTADGKRFRSRLHRMSLVYQAINYAADGRPIAVTMVNADPLGELKILPHPMLIDTHLGYQLIELDRFVDFYTRKEDENRNAIDWVKAQLALYKYAWAQRMRATLPPSNPDYSWKKYLDEIIDVSETLDLAKRALSEADLLFDPVYSPLTVKREFFDATLVDLIRKSASKDISVKEFGNAIYEQALAQYKRVSFDEYLSQTLVEQWDRPIPHWQIWAGVREKEFQSDPTSFLMLDGSPAIMPFDFIRQIAFTSPPAFADKTQSKIYNDSQPWEFPSIKEFIQSRVINGVQEAQRSQDSVILEDAGEFTILQRFFRMAFNGHLGTAFPVEKLILLSEAASAGAPTTITRTLRWQTPKPGGRDPVVSKFEDEIRRALGVDKPDEYMLRMLDLPLPDIRR